MGRCAQSISSRLPAGRGVGGGDGGPALPPNAELVQSQACTGDTGGLPRLPQASRPLWAAVPGASLARASIPWPHPPWLPTSLGLSLPPDAVASALFSVPTLTLCLGLQGWGRLLEEPGGIVRVSGSSWGLQSPVRGVPIGRVPHPVLGASRLERESTGCPPQGTWPGQAKSLHEDVSPPPPPCTRWRRNGEE